MRPIRAQQTAFTAGEVDPGLYGRTEVQRYYSGAAELTNLLVMPLGGVRARPGMAHIDTLPAAALNGARLVPFSFNTEQSYIMVLSDASIRIYLPEGWLVAAIAGMPHNARQAREMNVAQSADTLIMAHPDLPPSRLRRNGSHNAWLFSSLPLTNIPNHDYGSGPEPVISSTRGWPRSVTFHQGRLWFGGLRSRPATLLGSVVGDFWNFDTSNANDDRGINVTIDTDQVNAIEQVVSGRALQVFTSGAEFAVTSPAPITPGNIAIEEQTRRGIKARVPTAEMDGATLFVQRGGAGVRQFVYQDIEQAWQSGLASLLAPHLIRDPVAMAARKSARSDAADHVLLVNADGEASVLTTLRAQEITAWSRWRTPGEIRDCAALVTGEVFFLTLRNGTLRLERWSEDHELDAGRVYEFPVPQSVASGLEHLTGLTASIILDDVAAGEAVITGDTLALPWPARRMQIGLPRPWAVQTLPLEPREPAGHQMGRKMRVTRLTARVRDTSPFRMQGCVMGDRRADAPAPALDAAPPRTTGDLTLWGVRGWRERQAVRLENVQPGGRFTLLSLGYELGVL